MGEKTNDGASLSSPEAVQATKSDMGSNLSMGEYQAREAKKLMERMAKAAPPKQDEAEAQPDPEPVVEEAQEANAAETTEAEPVADKEHQGDTDSEGQETDEVLSKFEPKTQEKLQKRFDKLTQARKEAEERAKALEAKAAELEAKLQQQPEAKPQVELVPLDDPNDLTVKASNDTELAEIEKEARAYLTAYKRNEVAISRAIAKDAQTVTLDDGQEYAIDKLHQTRLRAEEQLEKYVPARRAYLQQRQQALHVAQQKFPAVFKKDTQEHQTLQAYLRQYRGLKQIPNLEILFGYALAGIAAEQAQAKATEAQKKAAPTPPKTAADTGAAPVKPAASKAASPRKQLEAKLAQAENEFRKSGSSEAHQQVLRLRSQLKQLN